MNERMNDERLNDYVDGLLVESLRALKARTAELPDSIEPSTDLWPGIAEKMAPAPLASVDEAARRSRTRAGVRAFSLGSLLPRLEAFQWATLAAAAMVLVVSSSAITAWVLQVPEVAVSTGGAAVTNVALDSLRPVEAEYALEIADLLTALMNNRDTLDPDTVTTIETNLRVIDRAIRRAREALEEDPENTGLARMLTHGYRNKLQVLQRASLLIERS